jgi:hypothetical protein
MLDYKICDALMSRLTQQGNQCAPILGIDERSIARIKHRSRIGTIVGPRRRLNDI